MKTKLLLPLFLIGMLAACGRSDNSSESISIDSQNPSVSAPDSQVPSASAPDSNVVSTISALSDSQVSSISTSVSVPDDDIITDIGIANSVAGSYAVKGVVVGLTTGSFIIKDETGVVMVYQYPAVPTVSIGDYVKVKGATAVRYANCQFDGTAQVTVLTEEAPDVSEDPTPLTAEYWNDFDGKIGKLVSGTVLLYEEGGRMYFKYEDCEMLGQFAFPDNSLGFVSANAGRFAEFTGYMLDTSTSTPNKHNVLATRITLLNIAATGVAINTPSTTTIEIGLTLPLSAEVTPIGAEAKITWTSDKPEVASVNANTGVVMGVDVGTAVITATAGLVEDTIEIEVVASTEKTYEEKSKYSFSSLASGSTNLDTSEKLMTVFTNCIINGDQVVESFSNISSVTHAHSDQGPKTTGIKLGTADKAGTMTLNLAEGTSVARVELLVYNWNSSSANNTLSINGSTPQKPAVAGSRLIFDITSTDEIAIAFDLRGVISEMILYTIAA